jgi:hypothetical protein
MAVVNLQAKINLITSVCKTTWVLIVTTILLKKRDTQYTTGTFQLNIPLHAAFFNYV